MSQSIVEEVRAGTEGRNPGAGTEADHREMLLTGLPLVWSVTLLIQPRFTCLGKAKCIVAGASYIKYHLGQCFTDTTTGQSDGGGNSSIEVPLSQVTLVYVKLTKINQ